MRKTSSPVPTLQHVFTPSHPDADAGLTFDQAVAAAERRGDMTLSVPMPLANVKIIAERINESAALILRLPDNMTNTATIWMVAFYYPHEKAAFEGWVQAQNVMAKMLGLTS